MICDAEETETHGDETGSTSRAHTIALSSSGRQMQIPWVVLEAQMKTPHSGQMLMHWTEQKEVEEALEVHLRATTGELQMRLRTMLMCPIVKHKVAQMQ